MRKKKRGFSLTSRVLGASPLDLRSLFVWLCKLERCGVRCGLALLGPVSDRVRSDSHSSVMAAARPVYRSVTRVSSLSSDLPASGEGPPIPHEVSPLLKPKRTHAHQKTISERWRAARSSFLNDNLGLLLVAASQFFFSAMGFAVKWLNSLDDPVPTLEVCMTHRGRIFSLRADFFDHMRS